MMGRALLVVGWFGTLGLILNGVLGFLLPEGVGFGFHVLIGLGASLLILFSHCWIMFYLIGTGKAVRVAVEEHDLDGQWIDRTKDFKNRSYPWLMGAMGLVMTTFILGGGVATRVVYPWIHSLLFAGALLVQLRTQVLELEVLSANDRLMNRLERQLAKVNKL